MTPKQALIATIAYFLVLLSIIVLADLGIARIPYHIAKHTTWLDKLGHFVLLGIASYLLNIAMACRVYQVRGWSFLLGSSILIVLSSLEEISQLFRVNRGFEIWDLIFNCAGILVFGQIAYYQYRRKTQVQDHKI